MKLKQIKEFNQSTVTQDFAAEMFALCVWNHYRDEKYKSKGFRIAAGTPIGVMKGGSKSPWEDEDAKRGFIKTATGVKMYSALEDMVRIYQDGHVMAHWRENSYSEYDHITRNKETGEEMPSFKAIPITQFPEIIQLYLDHGFFTIE